MDSTRKFLVEQVQGDIDSSSAAEFFKEKLRQLLHVFHDALGFLAEKVDQVFPPETREETLHQWLDFGLRVVLPVVVVLLLLYCCCCLGRRCCCGGGRRGLGRMMKAPGRHGARMPRATFEASPRDYFSDLRANKNLVF
ncbi:hypothetical protein Cni_G07164 [Canna indica]|uniref:Uncharacterized protein n=1 Tax=Canna indica TaxID=4628 RepID=A0AAQ3Q742_9LILI|nr:hypothetical protein Cni_G07164 [Canna indica]